MEDDDAGDWKLVDIRCEGCGAVGHVLMPMGSPVTHGVVASCDRCEPRAVVEPLRVPVPWPEESTGVRER